MVDIKLNYFRSKFQLFNKWDKVKLRGFMLNFKERILDQEEILVKDGLIAEYIYFLCKGSLKVEK